MENYDVSAAVLTSAVFVNLEPIDSPKVFENKSFRLLKELHFSESITSGILKL